MPSDSVVGTFVEDVAQTEVVDDRLCERGQRPTITPHEIAHVVHEGSVVFGDEEVVSYGQLFEELDALPRAGDAGARPSFGTPGRHIGSVEQHPTALLTGEAGDDVEQRRLPGAVRADETDHLARRPR